jgi:pimeloyl-[acyl-carrier protein] methyl ester esterase
MTACASVSATPAHAADRFLTIDGARLRYRDEGRGPAVLLLHGWTLDLQMWDPQVAALQDDFRLIRLDRRGHGFSDGTSDTQRDREDLAGLCRHLALTRVALIGMSQGARSALAFAARAPAQVSALILDGPPALDGDPDPDLPLQRYATLVRSHGIEAFRREWARHTLTELHTLDPKLRSLLHAMIERYSGNDLQAPRPRDRATTPVRLETIAAPALVLSGERDLPGRRRAAQQLASGLADAELAVVPEAGHLANLDRPDLYSKLCRAFLMRHCGP